MSSRSTSRSSAVLVVVCGGSCLATSSTFLAAPGLLQRSSLAARRPTSAQPVSGSEEAHNHQDKAHSDAASCAAAGMAMLAVAGAGARGLRRRAGVTASFGARAMAGRRMEVVAPNFVTPSPILSAKVAQQRGCMTAVQATGSAVLEVPPVQASYDVGQKIHGWTCTRTEYIQEFACTGYLFVHDKTKAQLMSVVQPADENKTFAVTFRTPPENSNGVAHVLEHSVLCGSRKYPVKEPFGELLKSSLQTFLNAMTFPDRTCYPVASCNLQDFYNLVDVYLDAVLHPRAMKDPKVLKQEGWHYQLESKEDPLKFKGVVFNEMKGVFSNPDNTHSRFGMQALFPDSPYGNDSGGDPVEIPNLDFEYMKEFHGKYYHPSNAKFWFYGDDPADKRLEILDSFLKDFEGIEVDSKVGVQPLFKEPRRVFGEIPAGEEEDISKKTIISVNWVFKEGQVDVETSWSLSFLNYLLMGTPAAPLYKALVDSGLGSRVIGGGLYEGLLQPIFSVGLKDIRKEDTEKVEEVITKTLTELSETGFEEDAVQAAINTIEFKSREMNTGSFPKGLALLFASMERWNYDNDPFEPLRFEEPLANLKAKLAKGEKIFEKLIKEKFLANTHKVVAISHPNKDLMNNIDEAEKSKLEAYKKTLDDEMLEKLMEEAKAVKDMAEAPDTPEALATVPRLQLSDIPKETPKVPTEAKGSSPTVLVHPLPTAGVVYLDVAFDLSSVPVHLMPLVPIFTGSLRQLGTSKGDFVSLTQRIDRDTGGVGASTTCMSQFGEDSPKAFLIVRGKSMADQVPKLVDLIEEITLMADFDDKERFVQLLRQSKAGAQSALLSSGHAVALRRLGAQTTAAGWINEQWGGMSQFHFLSKLLGQVEAGEWEPVVAQLKELQSYIFTQPSCKVLNITCEEKDVAGAQAALEAYNSSLPVKAGESRLVVPELTKASEAIVVPTQVNYVGKGGNLFSSGYELHGSALVVSKYVDMSFLWERVRMSGGAYGAFTSFDRRSGDFKYLSYRDPNLEKTLVTYDATPQFLKDLDIDDEALAKSIIGTMGVVDSYQLADAKGYQAMLRFLLNESDDDRQKLRDEILSTSAKDFKKFGEALESVMENGSVCVVSSKDAAAEVAEKFDLTIQTPLGGESPQQA